LTQNQKANFGASRRNSPSGFSNNSCYGVALQRVAKTQKAVANAQRSPQLFGF
jgi:hypothetical protein